MAKQEPVDPDALHRGAQEAVLTGLARGDDVDDLIAARHELGPLRPAPGGGAG